MGKVNERTKARIRHQAAIKLVAPEPSDVCLVCDKPLTTYQQRFCGPAHKDEWHAKARDMGELVMEMMIWKRRRKP